MREREKREGEEVKKRDGWKLYFDMNITDCLQNAVHNRDKNV